MLRANVRRFGTLALAQRTFGGIAGPHMVHRLLGYRLHLDVSRSDAHRLLYLEGARFVTELGLLRGVVRPSDVAVDVGANIGYYTLLLAHLAGPRGRILAFEPEPDNLAELQTNVARNVPGNAQVYPYAVGARAGTVSFARGLNGAVVSAGAPVDAVDIRPGSAR